MASDKLEKFDDELESKSTSSRQSAAIATALSFMWFAVSASVAEGRANFDPPLLSSDHQDSHQSSTPTEIRSTEVIFALERVYTELLVNRKDLDREDREALYSNLWDLYE